MPARLITLYDDNCSAMAALQKQVFKKFGHDIEQIKLPLADGKGEAHASALDSLLRESKALYHIIFDVDAFPLSISCIDEIMNEVEKGKLVGAAQSMDWTCNDHVYVGPACMGFSMETYEKLGRPSFLPKVLQQDVGQEFTVRAEARGVPVHFIYPISTKVCRWKMKSGHWMGNGMDYRLFYHAFEASKGGKGADLFFEKAYDMLNRDRPYISVVIPCSNRLEFATQTLPTWTSDEYYGVEVIFSDWSCPQHSGDRVEQQWGDRVKVVRNPGRTEFNLPAARNAGAGMASGKFLAFMDADVKPGPRQSEMWNIVNDDVFIHVNTFERDKALGIRGSCIVPRSAWAQVGYDDVLRGYGHDDDDFFESMQFLGLRELLIAPECLEHIHHGNEKRTEMYDIDSIGTSSVYNTAYSRVKHDIMRLSGRILARSERLAIRKEVVEAINLFATERTKDFATFEFDPHQVWLPHPLTRKLVYELDLARELEFR